MRKIIITITLMSLFLFTGSLVVKAQTPSSSPTTHASQAITFPIAELGNCTDVKSCKAYCDDLSHQDACIAYAKEKGFYKEPTNSSVLDAAKTELGCNSLDTCKTFCSQQTNQQKCSDFAKEHNLQPTPSVQPNSTQTLKKAQQTLGCDSLDSCKTFCSKAENQQKCSDFAKENGLKGGTQKVGPGGCTSEASCSEYCQNPDHQGECQQFYSITPSPSEIITNTQAHESIPSLTPHLTQQPSFHPEEHPTYIPHYPTDSTHPTMYPSYTPVVTHYPTPDHSSSASLPPTSPTIAFYQNYCNSHPNCSWKDNKCQCVPLTPPSPTITQHLNGPFTPTPIPTLSLPGVKGAATHINFFQALINFLRIKL